MKKLYIFLLCVFFILASNVHASTISRLDLYGDISNMTSKDDIRYVEAKYSSNSYNFNAFASLKIQGASSTTFNKKNFNISFFSSSDYSVKKNVNVGFGSHNKYTLKADWPDGTKSRNVVTADIYSQIQKKYNLFTNTLNYGVISGFPVEIYLNDEFYGIYNLTTSKDYIYGLDESNKNHLAIMAKEYDAKTNFSTLATDKWQSFEVELGEENDYSLSKLNRLIRFIKNSSDKEFKENFENYINLDSALNYYCYVKFGELYDNLNKNMMLVTYDGDYWYLTMYDLDISWGSTWDGTYLLDYTDMLDTYIDSSMLWSKFEKAFPNEIVIRYQELRKSILTKDNILNKFNTYYSSIPSSSFQKEDEKWGPLVGYGVDQVEEFLDVRIKLVDKDIESLKNADYDNVLNGSKDEIIDTPTNDDNAVNNSNNSNNVTNDSSSKDDNKKAEAVSDNKDENNNVIEDEVKDDSTSDTMNDEKIEDDIVSDEFINENKGEVEVQEESKKSKDKNSIKFQFLIVLFILLIMIILFVFSKRVIKFKEVIRQKNNI